MQHKIKEAPHHTMNSKTRAIVNSNDAAYNQAKKIRLQAVEKELEMSTLKTTVDQLSNQVSEIHDMLTKLLQK